jgi:TonB family protein
MTKSSWPSSGGGSRPGAQLATPAPAGFIGRYQVLEKIGEGGMGSLFLARDPAIDRLVAIKLLRRGLDTEALRERFSREARAAGRLRHPHIVTIFDVGEHDGDPFIAMEFLPGETVAELVRDGARLSLSRRLKLLEELCDGLAYAHRAGIVHRDIKPANLMVDADGILKILDFGIVRLAESGMTQAGVLVGTINYMSPEQVLGGTVDHRSDIFSVGLVAFELIAGRQAFPGTMKDGLLSRIPNVTIDPLPSIVPGLDPEVVAIVEQALKKEPAERYQDLVRMRNDLARVRVRLEREEEQAAQAASAEAGETQIIAQQVTLPGTPIEAPKASPPPDLVAHAERALADGNFRAALTLAGRSAAINPNDRSASGIVARAEAALLERGRMQEGSFPGGGPLEPASVAPVPGSSAAPAAPVPAPPAGRRTTWIASFVAIAALVLAAAAMWPRLRSGGDGRPPSQVREETGPNRPETTQRAENDTPPPAKTPPPEPPPPAAIPAPASPTPNAPAAGGTAAPASQPQPDRGETPPASSPRTASRTEERRKAADENKRGRSTGPSVIPPPLPAPPASARPPAAPLEAGIDVSAPGVVRRVQPDYPPGALASGIEGTVGVRVTIGPDGRVSDARIVRSVQGLNEAALAAARQWVFVPTQQNGVAVSVINTIEIAFTLPPAGKPTVSIPDANVTRPTAPPAPKPVPEAPRTAPPTDVREEIRAALRRYEAAWEARDIDALLRVRQLTAGESAQVRTSMAEANSIEVDISTPEITVDAAGRTADAVATVTMRFHARIGSVAPRVVRNRFHLEKHGEAWIITRLDAI